MMSLPDHPIPTPRLWVLWAALALADVALTAWGLSTGASETNPLVALSIAHLGILGHLALKGVALTIGLAVQRVITNWKRSAVPAAFAFTDVVAVTINLTVLGVV